MFEFSVSYTTRKPRPGEVEGINYFYVTRDEFQKVYLNKYQRIDTGDFIEHVEYAGNCYGTSKSYVESIRLRNKVIRIKRDMLARIGHSGSRNLCQKRSICTYYFPYATKHGCAERKTGKKRH